MFTRDECSCRCGCGFDTMDYETLEVFEDLSTWVGGDLRINSGCRCSSWNAYVGGSEKSWHMWGRACDVYSPTKTPSEVYDYLNTKYPDKYGMKLYSTFVHFDTRPLKWRGKKA